MIPNQQQPDWDDAQEGRQLANDELMRAMGSKKGSDPMPPDQYLYFLESEDREQKALAYVRSKTIRQKFRSPFAVDEHGRPITVTRMAADCGWQVSHTSELLAELEAQGLVRLKNFGNAGIRIFLCGEVALPSQRKQGEQTVNKRRGKNSVLGKQPGYLLNQISKLTPDIQKKAFLAIETLEQVQKDVEAEAIAAARAAVEPMWNQFYTQFGLEKRKLDNGDEEKPEKKRRCAVQITLFDEPAGSEDEAKENGHVQGNSDSVQSAAATSYNVSNDGVQRSAAGASFMYSETETEKDSVATTTTTSEPERPSSSSSPEPLSRDKFVTALAYAFTKKKGGPTVKQSDVAYGSLGDRAAEFLVWLQTADQFRRTETGAGLATLVEWFLDTPVVAPPPESQSDDHEYFERLAADNQAREERDQRIDALIEAMPQGEFLRLVMAARRDIKKAFPHLTDEIVGERATLAVRRTLGEEVKGCG